jgi:hypothetical protein
VLAGLSLPWVLIAIATSVQRDIEPAYLGRVAGAVHTLTFAPNAIGQAVCAGLLAIVDYRLMLIVLGAAGLLVSISCLWRFPDPGQTPDGPPGTAPS